ncbi:hypothetical protein Pflav_000540 [Phytohabitans flavus]|uniref:Uncharacterized protein n=1 Tax=Phytohabitans flavus TaxID=1076124 RepID=A0A6F8XIK2_9ACTN|nr:hypothetical protein Pflav_000540 [Phytohabitans flavus]
MVSNRHADAKRVRWKYRDWVNLPLASSHYRNLPYSLNITRGEPPSEFDSRVVVNGMGVYTK